MMPSNYTMQQFLTNDAEKQQWEPLGNPYMPFQQDGNHDKDIDQHHGTNSEAEGSSPPHASSGAESPDKSKQKRKEQNRAAQRAFRERKERYVKELEEKIKAIEEAHTIDNDRLRKENEHLRATIKQMESEIYTLKGAAMAFELSISKLREAGIEPPGIGTYGNGGLGELSPPASDRHSMTSGASECGGLSYTSCMPTAEHHSQQRRLSSSDKAMNATEEFAESEVERFKHIPDPITQTGAKMIPQNEVWDWFSRHPRFDDLDLELVCREVTRRAVCSGQGPVIPEYTLEEIAKAQLANKMQF
ncbi:hypothetical protein BX666DRAFT_1997818 [Dichotomocladium elegans]|nr:hypothetical protein BX666DRAFT_1997818 [Dichotomocladium elegans]